MASEDLGYWTFRGSDVRALLFYLSGDVQEERGGGGLRTVQKWRGGGGEESKRDIREGGRQSSQGETLKGTEMKEGGQWGAEEASSFLTRRDGSHTSSRPSSLCLRIPPPSSAAYERGTCHIN